MGGQAFPVKVPGPAVEAPAMEHPELLDRAAPEAGALEVLAVPEAVSPIFLAA
jgi:hypothetical protein